VRISPHPYTKLQATGIDRAGRVQYLYHPDYRARQEQAKFDRLIRFAERLPDLRAAMAEHIDLEPLTFEWTGRSRGASDQPRLVPRRRRALREEVPHLRDHDPLAASPVPA
jgi:hypothetical protein